MGLGCSDIADQLSAIETPCAKLLSTRGIDVKVKADIYALMRELSRKGKSIIMISEEIQELLGMSDRILIMKDGKINGEYRRDPALGEEDLIVKMV